MVIWFPRFFQVSWRCHIGTAVKLQRSQVKIVKDFNTELGLSCGTRSRNSFRFKIKWHVTDIIAVSPETAVKFKGEDITGPKNGQWKG